MQMSTVEVNMQLQWVQTYNIVIGTVIDSV